jgi:Peptidase C39 family
METLAELAAVCGLTWAGMQIGRRLSRGRFWRWGVAVPFMIVGLVMTGHRVARLAFVAPVSWVLGAQVDPVVMAGATACLLTVLSTRMRQRRQRIALAVLMAVMVGFYGMTPLLLPIAVRGDLLAGVTTVDAHGVCLQTHGYTCGPAAAVTCLRALGVNAEEGRMAVEARCGPVVGTDGALLAQAVNRRYGAQGVRCGYRYVGTLEGLRLPAVATVVSLRYGGHDVAVLAVNAEEVIVADPMSGRDRWSRADFLAEWTGAAVEFEKIVAKK